MDIHHILGPPGTGKTYRLMELMAGYLSRGYEPEEICFCSFTRAAVRQAKERALQQFGLTEDRLPFFGTLHSLCYRFLRVTPETRMGVKQWEAFCQQAGLAFTKTEYTQDVNDDIHEPIGEEEGDILRRFYDWARNCLMSQEAAAAVFEPPGTAVWSKSRAAWFWKEFTEYKNALGLYDFPDMLLETLREGWHPKVRVLIVDEAQDLSPLQQKLVLRWVKALNGTAETVLGYDVDQCIYDFQGADPRWLLALPGERETLTQSYRVPRLPAMLAQRIIGRNSTRYPLRWKPRAEEGTVNFDAVLGELVADAAEDGRKWYFLARNRCYLERYCDALEEAGVPYYNHRGHSPRVSTGMVAALELANGRRITRDQLRQLATSMVAKDWWRHGAQAEIKRQAAEDPERPVQFTELMGLGAREELLIKLSQPETCFHPLKNETGKKSFWLRVYRRYGFAGLTDKPLKEVSTFHGVKGGEAATVVVGPNFTRRTAQAYEEDPEPERRAWYVAASRTSERLAIIEPERGACFDEW